MRAYLYCDDCEGKHFLNLNMDIQGRWSIGYINYQTNHVLHPGNEFRSTRQAIEWVNKELGLKSVSY